MSGATAGSRLGCLFIHNSSVTHPFPAPIRSARLPRAELSSTMPNNMSEKERALSELCGKNVFWDGRRWYMPEDVNPRMDPKCWLWLHLGHLNRSDEICAIDKRYREQRVAAGPRLRYWAFVTRETANQSSDNGAIDGANFACRLGHYLAKEAVRRGQTGAVRSTQFEDILKEWISDPPYDTFWAEVQAAYLKKLESPVEDDGYKGYDEAETLVSDFDSKIAPSSREEGQGGEKAVKGSIDGQSTVEDGGRTTHASSAGRLRELSAADFVSLFPYAPPGSAKASTAG